MNCFSTKNSKLKKKFSKHSAEEKPIDHHSATVGKKISTNEAAKKLCSDNVCDKMSDKSENVMIVEVTDCDSQNETNRLTQSENRNISALVNETVLENIVEKGLDSSMSDVTLNTNANTSSAIHDDINIKNNETEIGVKLLKDSANDHKLIEIENEERMPLEEENMLEIKYASLETKPDAEDIELCKEQDDSLEGGKADHEDDERRLEENHVDVKLEIESTIDTGLEVKQAERTDSEVEIVHLEIDKNQGIKPKMESKKLHVSFESHSDSDHSDGSEHDVNISKKEVVKSKSSPFDKHDINDEIINKSTPGKLKTVLSESGTRHESRQVIRAKKRRSSMEIELPLDDGCDCLTKSVDRIAILQADDIRSHGIELDHHTMLQYMKKNQYKQLKMSLRHAGWGIRHDIRQSLWYSLCHHLHKADDQDIFSEFAGDLFSPDDRHVDIRLPAFVDLDHLNSYYLNPEGIQSAKQILCVLEHSCPDIIYSPVLFSVLCLFLHYMDTSKCYNCMYALLRQKDSSYISTTKVSHEASKYVIRDLAKKYAKSGYVHIVRNCGNIDQVFDSWIWWIFEELPFPYLVRVMDCYLNEGVKVFYRVVLAILSLFGKTGVKKSIKDPSKRDTGTSNSVVISLRQFCRELPVSIDKLLKTGFQIRGLTRKEIKKLQVKHEMYINSTKNIGNYNEAKAGGRITMSKSFSGPIVLQNLGSNMLTPDMREDKCRSRSVGSLHVQPPDWRSAILDRGALYAILTWLPTRYAICTPELLYTSEEHGTSLVTLYERVEHHQPTIIVIKTTLDEVFGAFCSTYWRERKQKSKLLSYFGTGETFLFTLAPEKHKYEWVGLTQDNIPNTASMFQAGDRSILTVGGGHGEAISLDENLLHCRSERCDTFNNEPLSQTEDFTCKVVEVYGFQ